MPSCRPSSFVPRFASAVVACAALGAGLSAQQRHALHVALLTSRSAPAPERQQAFVDFLSARFAKVSHVEVAGLDAQALAGVDVVLLDWDQQAGVMKWFGDDAVVPASPLGARADWRTPTVLLGSAGLNVAATWNVRGGSG